jgi:hypothetical protein
VVNPPPAPFEIRDFMRCYVLDDDNNPVRLTITSQSDVEKWAEFRMDHARSTVKQEYVGPAWVSTVFLGLDHGMGLNSAPGLFETMVFDMPGAEGNPCERCCTWAEAEEQHGRVVAEVRKKLDLGDD